MSREGPRVALQMSCMGCVFERSPKELKEVYCDHPQAPYTGYVGIWWDTPSWCPLRAAALEAFLAEVKP